MLKIFRSFFSKVTTGNSDHSVAAKPLSYSLTPKDRGFVVRALMAGEQPVRDTPSSTEAATTTVTTGAPAGYGYLAFKSARMLSDTYPDPDAGAAIPPIPHVTPEEPLYEMTLTLQDQLTACALAKVHVLLTGRPGISKSTTAAEIGRLIATETKRPFYSIVLPEDTPVAELRGHYMPGPDGKFHWHDGPVTVAVREGGVLLLDELSHLSPEATTFLHAALDGSDITLPTGETVRKHPDMWAIATQNDEAEILRPAIMDRFGVRIALTVPPKTALDALPKDLRVMAIAEMEKGEGSLRPWFTYARLREVMAHKDAAYLVWPKAADADHIARVLAVEKAA